MHALDNNPGVLLAALERANEAILIVDDDLRVNHFNAAAELIWGINRAEVLGRHASCLGLDDLHEMQRTAAGANESGGENAKPAGDRELTIRRKDGSRVRAMLSLAQIEAAGESRTIAFVRDITDEAELRERLALVTLIADGTNRAVLITDRKLKIIYGNAAFSGMFGYSPEEARGRQAYQLLAGRHTRKRALARLRRVVMEEGRGGEEEILGYDSNGDEIWISANVRAFRDRSGRIKYVCAILSDVTETRQLRSLQQLILSALADELPITAIADQLCRRVEELAPDVVASVLHIDAGGHIHPLGAPSLPEDYSKALDGVAIGPNVGSCGSAAYFGKPMLATDIDADPRWQPYQARPLEVGLRAAGRRRSRPRTVA